MEHCPTYRALFVSLDITLNLHMRACTLPALFLVLAAGTAVSRAQQLPASFTGTWSIDLRTPEQKREKVECGTAAFSLAQNGSRVVGNHWFVTANCGRENQGGEGSVKGVVVGRTAVLVVTSGRNGQIVLGSATVRAGALHWKVSDEIKPGDIDGDSGLILHEGVLRKESP
jgi:hypothetical protein